MAELKTAQVLNTMPVLSLLLRHGWEPGLRLQSLKLPLAEPDVLFILSRRACAGTSEKEFIGDLEEIKIVWPT